MTEAEMAEKMAREAVDIQDPNDPAPSGPRMPRLIGDIDLSKFIVIERAEHDALVLDRQRLMQYLCGGTKTLYDDKEALRTENKQLIDLLRWARPFVEVAWERYLLASSPDQKQAKLLLDEIDVALSIPPKEEPNEQTTNRSGDVTNPQGA